MNVEELPLFELFTHLREAGLPLGVGEYQLVLRALQAEYGKSDRAALARLCKTLWVKSNEDERIFDYHFEQVVGPIYATQVSSTNANTDSERSERSEGFNIRRYLIFGTAILGMGILVFGPYWRMPSSTVQQGNNTNTSIDVGDSDAGDIPKGMVTNAGGNTNAEGVTNAEESDEDKSTQEDDDNSKSDEEKSRNRPIVWSLVGVSALTAVLLLIRQLRKRRDTRTDLTKEEETGPTLPAELTQQMEDEIEVVKAVRRVFNRKDDLTSHLFQTTSDYLPLSRRQMKQSWRRLRRLVREGPATELDLEATIKHIGQQGILLKPVFVPRRINRTELLILVDQDGSMVPFHSLAHRMVETVLQGSRLAKAEIYYFHNCPNEHLYQDPNHLIAETVHQVLFFLRPQYTGVLIISDAGAARGGFNPERVELTAQFLDKLKQRIRHIVWLNPMPQPRWLGTTADEISYLVPMFELDRNGLDAAIKVLRGQASHH
ncbi:MAG: VWA domain-containing protein [Cyanothece sp. SIO1E1]|nr:VWA domain-containing protein [Cyanothece sp. SIO1E1]